MGSTAKWQEGIGLRCSLSATATTQKKKGKKEKDITSKHHQPSSINNSRKLISFLVSRRNHHHYTSPLQITYLESRWIKTFRIHEIFGIVMNISE